MYYTWFKPCSSGGREEFQLLSDTYDYGEYSLAPITIVIINCMFVTCKVQQND